MWKQNAISYVAIRISTPPINATSIYLSISLSIYLYIYMSVYLSIYLSLCVRRCLSDNGPISPSTRKADEFVAGLTRAALLCTFAASLRRSTLRS